RACRTVLLHGSAAAVRIQGGRVCRKACGAPLANVMRISLVQMNSRANRLEENVERACGFVARAAGDKAELVVLPEFFNREYFPQYRDYKYMDYAEADDGYTQTRIRAKAREHGVYIVST